HGAPSTRCRIGPAGQAPKVPQNETQLTRLPPVFLAPRLAMLRSMLLPDRLAALLPPPTIDGQPVGCRLRVPTLPLGRRYPVVPHGHGEKRPGDILWRDHRPRAIVPRSHVPRAPSEYVVPALVKEEVA